MNPQNDTEQLLGRLSDDWPASSSIVGNVMHAIESTPSRKSIAARIRGLTVTQRVAAGGLGLSAVILLAVTLFSIGTAERASAMERMIEKLGNVTSWQCTFHSKHNFTRDGAERPVTVEQTGTFWWIAPDSWRDETRIIDYDAHSPRRENRLLSEYVVILPAGRPGLLVDHRRKTVLWVSWEGDFPDYSPANTLRMVRENSGEMVRELGSRIINGRQAHGFVMRLDGAAEGTGFDALEVWLDPKTDLPVECGYVLQKEEGPESYQLSNCRWNIDLDPQLFEPIVPDGYTDTTPPKSAEAIGEVTAALRLYAELSGGHYPRVTEFDGDAVKEEMLRMAGFVGEHRPEWTASQKFQQVENASQGLEWLTRILQDTAHKGYNGMTVEARHKDKVLLWWFVEVEKSIRVFYGDLRTEVLEGDWKESYDRLWEETYRIRRNAAGRE